MLQARGRIRLRIPLRTWVERALRGPGIHLLPLTPRIAIESTRLPGDPPGDAADRMLIASARVQGGRLATCDGAILEYAKGRHVTALDGRR